MTASRLSENKYGFVRKRDLILPLLMPTPPFMGARIRAICCPYHSILWGAAQTLFCIFWIALCLGA